jgi:hypothetical protein
MLFAGIALVVVGVIFGLFFPVVFVVALAGVILSILSLVAGARRARVETGSADRGVDRVK